MLKITLFGNVDWPSYYFCTSFSTDCIIIYWICVISIKYSLVFLIDQGINLRRSYSFLSNLGCTASYQNRYFTNELTL